MPYIEAPASLGYASDLANRMLADPVRVVQQVVLRTRAKQKTKKKKNGKPDAKPKAQVGKTKRKKEIADSGMSHKKAESADEEDCKETGAGASKDNPATEPEDTPHADGATGDLAQLPRGALPLDVAKFLASRKQSYVVRKESKNGTIRVLFGP
jgi:hypothetical protein